MKKSVIALAMAFGVSSAFAQDLTSKKGEPILPEAGDWAISADATPFFNYIGRIGNASNNAPTFDFLGGPSQSIIMGKYFVDEKTAFRAGLNIGFGTHSATNLVNQDQPGTIPAGNPFPQVTDKAVHSTSGVGITVGIEKRKGKTRLQGYYGAELCLYVGGSGDKYTYGNQFAGTGTAVGTSAVPTSTTWTLSGNTPTAVTPTGTVGIRPTDVKGGTNFQFGVRGFIGVEYFVLPKISLGGEFGWAIGMKTIGLSQTTNQAIYTGTSASTQVVKSGSKTTDFVFGSDNLNSIFGPVGSIRMNFYF